MPGPPCLPLTFRCLPSLLRWSHDFKDLCRHNRDGSYATQADREHILDLVADQLHEMGYRGLRAQGMKPKHVEKLIARWFAEAVFDDTSFRPASFPQSRPNAQAHHD